MQYLSAFTDLQLTNPDSVLHCNRFHIILTKNRKAYITGRGLL